MPTTSHPKYMIRMVDYKIREIGSVESEVCNPQSHVMYRMASKLEMENNGDLARR